MVQLILCPDSFLEDKTFWGWGYGRMASPWLACWGPWVQPPKPQRENKWYYCKVCLEFSWITLTQSPFFKELISPLFTALIFCIQILYVHVSSHQFFFNLPFLIKTNKTVNVSFVSCLCQNSHKVTLGCASPSCKRWNFLVSSNFQLN